MNLVLEETPNVLSLGKLVVEEGYSFEWSHGKPPNLKSPDGTEHVLVVLDMVPYIDVGMIQASKSRGKPSAISPNKGLAMCLQALTQKKPSLQARAKVHWRKFRLKMNPKHRMREAKLPSLKKKGSESMPSLSTT